jgi:predicted  nucleic acid-binding Zn-ribbon protein
MPTSEDLSRLLSLQEADDAVRRLQHRLAGLAEQTEVDELSAQDATLATGDAELRERLDRALRDQRQVEGEIDALTQRREEEQRRLYDGSLTSAREVQAAEAEIASTRRRTGEHEEQLLEILEVVEGLEAQLADLRTVRDRLAERLTEATARRDAAAQDLIVRIAEAQVLRDPIAAALPDELRSQYEEAAVRGGGTGVGVLKDYACSACRITFPMTEIDALLSGPPLTRCTQCKRLLVVPE